MNSIQIQPNSSPVWYGQQDPIKFPYVSAMGDIQKLIPQYSEQLIAGLMVDRKGGLEESNMTALGLHTVMRRSHRYKVTSYGLSETASKCERFLKNRSKQTSLLPSKFVKVEGIWDKESYLDGGKDNILGGNGRFCIKSPTLNIPVVEANQQDLAYFGATLVMPGAGVLCVRGDNLIKILMDRFNNVINIFIKKPNFIIP